MDPTKNWKHRMDRLASMALLLEAVDTGSLSSASRRLGIPLATVSRKISELEAHLGAQICIRTGRGIALTDPGRTYVDACRRLLEDLAEAERVASGEYRAPSGVLTIAVPIVFGRLHVVPLLAEFAAAYPDVDVRLDLSDRITDFRDDHVDVAIRIGTLSDDNLIAAKVGETRPVICASPAYLASRGTPVSPSDLASHQCVTFERLDTPQVWMLGDKQHAIPVPVRSRLSVTTAEAAIDAALAGIGITRVLSYQVAPLIHAGRLIYVLAEFEPTASPVQLVYPGQGRMPMKLRAFLDFITPRLKVAIRKSAL